MNDSDLEFLLQRIINRSLIFSYNDKDYTLYQPNSRIKYKAEIIYDHIINDEKYEDWLRFNDVENYLIVLGLWMPNTKDQIKNIEQGIDTVKIDLFKNYRIPEQKKNNKKQLSRLKKQLSSILDIKNDFASHTLEFHALNLKNQYIIKNTLRHKGKKVFTSDNIDYVFFNALLRQINEYNINIDKLKLLARSQLWRSYWNADKNNIFPDSVINWSDDQRILVNVSRMYDSVYDHPECPDDDVIEDDDALDGWMLLQKENRKKEKKEKQFQSINPKLKNAQNVYFPAESQKDIQEINNLNDATAKALIAQDNQAIKNSDQKLKSYELPSEKHKIQSQINDLQKKQNKRK
jgi:hypothetical protein